VTLLYVDTSALFKRYVEENESEAVLARIEEAPAVGTALITRVEVAAALAQAVRQRRMARNEAQEAEREFLDHWDDHHVERLAEDIGTPACWRAAWRPSRGRSTPSARSPAHRATDAATDRLPMPRASPS
jgi:uncharacterized protein with PIN domain